ncbi:MULTISPECIES: hypothetical protein [Bradyrhizobium]|uniref:hypothetical protein n=1 Tax=Bradyrhizobium TaxID=374 RepID=UPI0015CF1F6C|nr:MULTISPECIES: hypothetical protein [Bradyrhizobium]
MSGFLTSLLKTESEIVAGKDPASKDAAQGALQSFLLSFASRAASRERLHVFTTNYDRLIEHGSRRFDRIESISKSCGAVSLSRGEEMDLCDVAGHGMVCDPALQTADDSRWITSETTPLSVPTNREGPCLKSASLSGTRPGARKNSDVWLCPLWPNSCEGRAGKGQVGDREWRACRS